MYVSVPVDAFKCEEEVVQSECPRDHLRTKQLFATKMEKSMLRHICFLYLKKKQRLSGMCSGTCTA